MSRMSRVLTATAAAPAAGGHYNKWNSPIPYLFGGLGLMLGLIAFALLILACSYRKFTSAQNSSDQVDEKPAKPITVLQLEMEPKINLVIMAGDEKPRYLAMPISTNKTSDPH